MRLVTKAKIKRASRLARENATIVDSQALSALTALYSAKLDEINAILETAADGVGIVRVSHLQEVKRGAARALRELELLQRTALFERMGEVAALGVDPFAERLGARRVSGLVNSAVKASQDFFAADGLQLSDRLWTVSNHASEVTQQAIQSAIIQGKSASAAAQDFLLRGQPIPVPLQQRINAAGSKSIARMLGTSMMTGAGTPYKNALRLFRTEINRAHITAYQQSAFETDDVVGLRFLLSPNHPETDICDMHARVNLYGLGAGVYPEGKSPLPAHPATISYEEVVFADEVTDEDKQGRQSRIDWLKTQPGIIQRSVLGGNKKQQAFAAGVLTQNEILTPWRILKKRYASRGIDVENFVSLPSTIVRRAVVSVSDSNPFSGRINLPLLKNKPELLDVIASYAGSIDFAGAPKSSLQSIASAFDKVLGTFGSNLGALHWIKNRRNGRALGLYRHSRIGFDAGGTDSIELRKTYVLKGHKNSNIEHQAYLVQRERNLGRLDERLKTAENERHKAYIIDKISKLKRATRWGHEAVSNDAIFSLVAHESGHAVFYRGRNIKIKWTQQLAKHKVTELDWYGVSEYAATSESELFAETTAFMASGHEHLLPDNIRKAYTETLKDYKGMP